MNVRLQYRYIAAFCDGRLMINYLLNVRYGQVIGKRTSRQEIIGLF